MVVSDGSQCHGDLVQRHAAAMQAANSLALGTSPIVRALVDPEGGMRSVRALDNVSFTQWFKSHGGSEGSIRRMWDPIAYALGFLNCDQVRFACCATVRQPLHVLGNFFACYAALHSMRPTHWSQSAWCIYCLCQFLSVQPFMLVLRERGPQSIVSVM